MIGDDHNVVSMRPLRGHRIIKLPHWVSFSGGRSRARFLPLSFPKPILAHCIWPLSHVKPCREQSRTESTVLFRQPMMESPANFRVMGAQIVNTGRAGADLRCVPLSSCLRLLATRWSDGPGKQHTYCIITSLTRQRASFLCCQILPK